MLYEPNEHLLGSLASGRLSLDVVIPATHSRHTYTHLEHGHTCTSTLAEASRKSRAPPVSRPSFHHWLGAVRDRTPAPLRFLRAWGPRAL